MHLFLDEERTLLRDTVRAFAKDQVRPKARAMEEAGALDAPALDAAWQLGFAGLGVPHSYGGAGESEGDAPSALTNVLVIEELAWADLGFALRATQPLHATVPLSLVGHEHLKREVLPAVLASPQLPRVAAACIEPSPLFDLATMTTRARSDRAADRQGASLSGAKTLVPGGDRSDVTVVWTAPGGAAGVGPELFVVLGDKASGMRRVVRTDVIAPRACALVDVALDDTPAKRLAQQQGTSSSLLPRALVGSAAAAVGVAAAALELAADYAKERRAFGRAIGQNQSIAFMLADSATDVEAARLLVWKAAVAIDKERVSGAPCLAEASRAFRFATDLCFTVADRGVQIFGGHGVIRDHLAELFFRNARTLARTPGWFIA